MNTPDAINAGFEGGAAVLLWLNVRRALTDKKVRGVSAWPVALFALWGWWNLWYYPHLGQWWSFLAGIGVVFANTCWALLLVHYRRRAFQLPKVQATMGREPRMKRIFAKGERVWVRDAQLPDDIEAIVFAYEPRDLTYTVQVPPEFRGDSGLRIVKAAQVR